jgi:hypothetical protein
MKLYNIILLASISISILSGCGKSEKVDSPMGISNDKSDNSSQGVAEKSGQSIDFRSLRSNDYKTNINNALVTVTFRGVVPVTNVIEVTKWATNEIYYQKYIYVNGGEQEEYLSVVDGVPVTIERINSEGVYWPSTLRVGDQNLSELSEGSRINKDNFCSPAFVSHTFIKMVKGAIGEIESPEKIEGNAIIFVGMREGFVNSAGTIVNLQKQTAGKGNYNPSTGQAPNLDEHRFVYFTDEKVWADFPKTSWEDQKTGDGSKRIIIATREKYKESEFGGWVKANSVQIAKLANARTKNTAVYKPILDKFDEAFFHGANYVLNKALPVWEKTSREILIRNVSETSNEERMMKIRSHSAIEMLYQVTVSQTNLFKVVLNQLQIFTQDPVGSGWSGNNPDTFIETLTGDDIKISQVSQTAILADGTKITPSKSKVLAEFESERKDLPMRLVMLDENAEVSEDRKIGFFDLEVATVPVKVYFRWSETKEGLRIDPPMLAPKLVGIEDSLDCEMKGNQLRIKKNSGSEWFSFKKK